MLLKGQLPSQAHNLRRILAAMNARCFFLSFLLIATQLPAQSPSAPPAAPVAEVWQMQASGSTASLRGILSVDGNVAWASGTGGTVLRTLDGGQHWLPCATPDGNKDGATLDFRGVQAWDAETAIVMASGPGSKSRLYKTADGCGTWKLLLRNPDKDGFWDAVRFFDRNKGVIVGDPVNGKLYARMTFDGGETWHPFADDSQLMIGKESGGFFAASNSCVILRSDQPNFIEAVANVGGVASEYWADFGSTCEQANSGIAPRCRDEWRWEIPSDLQIPSNSGSNGVFALGWAMKRNGGIRAEIAVGGDYSNPNETQGTAAYLAQSSEDWQLAAHPPHGYRSTVQWFQPEKLWITAGTNGSDFSLDDGRTWQPLDNGDWNALSLPFVVGPKGRIARIDPDALRARVKAQK
jgi:hypothetical protein